MTNSNDQKMGIISKWLAIIALLSVSGTLLSTFIAILYKMDQKGDLLELTKILLSWQFIAGGLIIGGGKEIKNLINGMTSRISNIPSNS